LEKWCNWKCMVSEQSYMSARKWSLVVSTLFFQLGDWRRPHRPPSGSTSHHSTRPATFQWHVEGTPVPLRKPCGHTQAIGPS
jgi:hypothetical protein